MAIYTPPAEYVRAAQLAPHVDTSRVTRNAPALLRQPVAWVLWPVLPLTRVEDGLVVDAVLVDLPGVPRCRVFYATTEDVLRYLQHCERPGEVLTRRKHYLDYRTVQHLLDDGWQVN